MGFVEPALFAIVEVSVVILGGLCSFSLLYSCYLLLPFLFVFLTYEYRRAVSGFFVFRLSLSFHCFSILIRVSEIRFLFFLLSCFEMLLYCR